MSHLVFGAEYKRAQQMELLPVLKPSSLLAFEPSRLLAFIQTTHRLIQSFTPCESHAAYISHHAYS